MELTLFKTNCKADLESCEIENNRFLEEYLKLGSIAQIAKWKKLALNTDFDEGEKIIFDLLLSLKEDILRLENSLNRDKTLLKLKQEGIIEALNFEYLNFSDNILEKDSNYYLRFDLNNQKIAVFIKAQNNKLAKIIKIKPEDKIAFDAFVVEIQRELIRNKKG
ncbi:hypothetical protein N4T57_00180 [Campylobacter hepaticus]|uniref:Uncharacterized protein n=1 Tax=Campylobacter hepaticus TaxID=1813019 RepID=A0A6A7JSH7_9BACT|nr:hypothetical protein [Campylobacter hepaticus]AXP09105.1 hypothetical protein A2J15_005270 [Campylobacter hepaticus]MCZ0771597.1 hypothetical protein [Campylobacter hepaticus]MCZ0773065.1 hypothetical protein [Campylobacter hepaticus]MCZ0775745.1 hypothetical protein [Campylobacter hepaticus]MDX2323476.1 hypothetical protein [Campylobacter hepaticus]